MLAPLLFPWPRSFYTHFFNYRLATGCELRCCGVEYILLFGFNLVWYFCNYDCLVVALSAFCTCILSWSADVLSQYNDILSYTTTNKENALQLRIGIASTNFAKTLDRKCEFNVAVWRHKHRPPSNNDHHTPLSLLEWIARTKWAFCVWGQLTDLWFSSSALT